MKDKILELIAEHFNMEVEELREDMSFQDDLGADSIDLVELMMSVEDEIGFELDDEKLEKIQTISDVLDYIEDEE